MTNKNLSYTEKFQAIQHICNRNASIKLTITDNPKWYISTPGLTIKLKKDTLQKALIGDYSDSPTDAINSAWLEIESGAILFKDSKEFVWTGFMFQQIN